MNRISAWLYNFMRGRYGFDQLGQALSVGVVVMWIFSILCGVLANMLRMVWLAWLSTILNWVGLISQRNSDLFTGVEGSMVFYHNSIAQIMGSMGLVGIAAYGVLMRDRIALLRAGKTPFVRALALSYLGMLLISLTNPGEFCPFPNAALMVMVFTLAEEATGDVAVPVGEMLGLRPTRRIYLPQK